ncbi:MAG: hypothetical protein ACREON_18185, partial [Gemmatimonadaceae bacterium]
MAGLDELRAQLSARRHGSGGALLRRAAVLYSALLSLAGCRQGEARDRERERPTAPLLVATASGRVPMDTALAHFRSGLPAVTELENGSPSLSALVRRFAAAVERGDTAAVRTMLVSRAEFAYIYFPQTVLVRPPFMQDPALAWFLSIQDSRKGITRTFGRFAGHRGWLSRHDCPTQPTLEGGYRLWVGCRVIVHDAARDSRTLQIFGPIIERNGRFKFLTYS